jgi:adenine deaminase
MIRSLPFQPNISAEQFKIKAPALLENARVRVIELVNQNITAEKIMSLESRDGYIEADLQQDLLKVAMFDRHDQIGKIANGFLKGFGASIGAVGTTINLDENTLLIVGSSDSDMALCANALIEMGGGMAVINHGQTVEKIDCPVGGIFSLSPWREVGHGLRRIHRCLREQGSPFDRPLYALSFLSFVTLPSLRITARGLINAKERKVVPLFVD